MPPSRRYEPPELVGFGDLRQPAGSGAWTGCAAGPDFSPAGGCVPGGTNKVLCSGGCTNAYKTGGCTNGPQAQNCSTGGKYTGPGCNVGDGVTGFTCATDACCPGSSVMVNSGTCAVGGYAATCSNGTCPVPCYSNYCTYS